jgi:hypothetical protein
VRRDYTAGIRAVEGRSGSVLARADEIVVSLNDPPEPYPSTATYGAPPKFDEPRRFAARLRARVERRRRRRSRHVVSVLAKW